MVGWSIVHGWLFQIAQSLPIFVPVVGSLDGLHAGLPVLVAQSISDGIGLSAGTEQTPEVGVGLEVADREEEQAPDEDHRLPDLLVVSAPARPPLQEEEEVGDVVGHLGSRGWGAVLVVDEAVMELSGHTDDHVVEVGVEVFALGDFKAVRGLVVVACHDVVDVVDASRPHPDLGEVHGPDSSVGVLALILREVGGIDVVVNVSA